MSGRQVVSRYWRGWLVLVWLMAAAGAGALANDAPELPQIVTHDNAEAAGGGIAGALPEGLRSEVEIWGGPDV